MKSLDRLDKQKEAGRKSRLIRMCFFNQLSEKQDPYFKFSDFEFQQRFRFSKECVFQKIYPLVKDQLSCTFGSQLSPMLQLLVALRFYGCGSFQQVVGDSTEISQTSVHRIIKKVSLALAQHFKEFVKFPTFTQATKTRQEFMKVAQFPGVTGVIDCTHIVISSPGGPHAEIFRNRKGKFSINVQAVCDESMKFTNIVARWPVSTHDSRIFLASRLKHDLESNNLPSCLIGDGGYGVYPYLLTPYQTVTTAGERRYNKALRSTRSIIERAFGIWKKKFSCLGSILRTKLETTLIIIVACSVLHNIALEFKEYDLEHLDEFDPDENDCGEFDQTINPGMDGIAFRNRIIAQYFQ